MKEMLEKSKKNLQRLYTKGREGEWKQLFLSFQRTLVRQKLKITLSLTALIVVALLSVGFYQAGMGYKVVFNGQEIGMVKQQEEFQQVLSMVNEEVKLSQGYEVTFKQNCSFEKIRVQKENLTTEQDFRAAIYESISLKTAGAVIKVNDEEIVAVQTKQEAEEILQEIKKPYSDTKENVEIKEVSFKDKIEVVEEDIALEKVITKEEALNYLQQGTDEIKVYEVASGDTTWDISREFDLGIRDIEKANPDVELEDLHPGDKINLTVPKPFISVESVQEVVYTEQVPYETTYKDDNSIYKDQQKVMTTGKYGTKEIKAEVIYENGIEKTRNILSEKIIKEPTTQVVAKGTKKRPALQGTGKFKRPTWGSTGSRGLFGVARSGGRTHTGIDIANSTGTPIYAADGGTVTSYIGYRGGYGYIVEINHGGSYTSRYAHLSKILVSAGQRVAKGQQIAKMGNTGNSTGPHLHFEIRRNGTPLNPFKFIPR